MAKRKPALPSLFDEEDDVPAPAPQAEELPPSKWQEVPQAVFDSWSDARQFSYCAARDLDSALHAETLEEAQWFHERSKYYQKKV